VLFPLFRARQNGAKSEDFLSKSRHKFTRAKQIQQSIPMARNQEKANVRRFTIKCCLLSLFFLFLERSLLSRLYLNRRLHLSDAFV
jgi:hypothetical protein